MNTPSTIVYRDPADLKLHKLQKHIPEPDKDSAEWQAFKDGMASAGPGGIPPLFITQDGHIMDGGWRWRAAKALQWESVPCIVRPEEHVGAIIVETLIHRKQMTRGAAIYMVLPLLEDFINAAESRRLGNLRQGSKTRENPFKVPMSSKLDIGSDAATLTELCERWGVSRDTFNRARKVRSLLHDPAFADLAAMFKKTRTKVSSAADLGELQIKLRQELEPELLSGEKNLWNVISAIAGKLPGNQTGRDEAVTTSQLELFTHGFEALRQATGNAWKKFDAEKRTKVIDEWRRTAKAWPADLRGQMKSVLEELEEK